MEKKLSLLDPTRLMNESYHPQREELSQAKAGSEMEDEQTNWKPFPFIRASNLHCSAAEHPPYGSQNSMSLASAVPCGAAQEDFEMEETCFRKIKTSKVCARLGWFMSDKRA